jgi:hypothetical protein
LRAGFLEWLANEDVTRVLDGEDRIDPRNFLKWSRTLKAPEAATQRREPFAVNLSGTDGRAGRYSVIPIKSQTRICWLDASGFQLAISPISEDFPRDAGQSNDYDLIVENGEASVMRTF